MKKLTVYIPEKLYGKLKRLKEKGKLRSISEAVRIALLALLEGGLTQNVMITRKITMEETIVLPARKKTELGIAVYGEHQAEIVKQLKQALAIKKKK